MAYSMHKFFEIAKFNIIYSFIYGRFHGLSNRNSEASRKSLALTVAYTASIYLAANESATAQHMNASDSPCQQYAVTVEVALCLDGATKKADADLNETYRMILQSLDSEEKSLLVGSQRLWVRYRDAFCAAERGLYRNGTASGPAHMACIEAITRRQTEELRTTYWWRVKQVSE